MPSLTIPSLTNRYIVGCLGYGVVILGWLTPEGNAVWFASLLGVGLAYLLLGLGLQHWWGGHTLSCKHWMPLSILLGLGGGLAASLCTFLLMLIKNVQHSHLVLDFPSEVLLGTLERTPAWMVAGGLIHLALLLIYIAFRHPSTVFTSHNI
jgi:hypothetical protein